MVCLNIWNGIRSGTNGVIGNFTGSLPTIKIEDVLKVPPKYQTGIVKCRFSYNDQGFLFQFENYTPKKIQFFKLVFDDAIDYGLKYSDRKVLASLLDKREDCDEIIIIKNGFVTDTSYSNLVFFDGTDWYTPANPLLAGTNRARLLQQGMIKEMFIRSNNLSNFSQFKMINAMLEFSTQPVFDISAIKN